MQKKHHQMMDTTLHATLPGHNISVKVSSHRKDGIGVTYYDHIFEVEVHCGAILYHVDRSYVDFVELDIKLRKIYPRCRFDRLPLDAYNSIAGYLKKEGKRRESNLDSRQSILLSDSSGNRLSSVSRSASMSMSYSAAAAAVSAGVAAHYSLLCSGSRENVENKLSAINLYLRQLSNWHEILVSDLFISFISYDVSGSDEINEVDILLQDEIPVCVTVRNIEEASFLVKPSQLVAWKFSTAEYDIGFSVEVNSESKLILTRYKSCERPISGSVEIGMTGVCVLRWDNSYSKLYNKNLQWAARVIDADEYNLARNEALARCRERKRIIDQKNVILHAALRHAAAVSGVIHTTALKLVIQEEEYHQHMDLVERAKRAEYEKKIALDDLSNALHSVDTLVDAKTRAEAALSSMSARAESAEERTIALEADLQSTHNKAIRLSSQITLMSDEIADLQSELEESTSTVQAMSLQLPQKVEQPAIASPIDYSNSNLLGRIRELEVELFSTRNAYLSTCQHLVDAKNESSHLASELLLSAQREDENRDYIEELQQQLAQALNLDDACAFDESLYYKSQGDNEDESLASALSDYPDSMSGKQISEHQRVNRKWQ